MKILVWAQTGIHGSRVKSTIEVDDNDWQNMTADQRDEFCQEAMFELIEWSYEEQHS